MRASVPSRRMHRFAVTSFVVRDTVDRLRHPWQTVAPPPSRWRAAFSAIPILLLLFTATESAANGAFPDSGQVLLPADRPNEIIASTNFGLLISRDGGNVWRWVCEEAIGPLANLYQLGPSPGNSLFAQSNSGLHISRDGACSWALTGGTLAGAYVVSAFPDPSDAARVLAVALPEADGGGRMGMFESLDGGASFGPPLFTVASSELLTGVESSKSDPSTIYLTMYAFGSANEILPALVRSRDGGQSWMTFDAGSAARNQLLRLIRVHPSDPQVVYLRASGSQEEALIVTRDGGESLEIPLVVPSLLTAFLLRANGDVIVGTRDSGAFISRDGARTFDVLSGAPRLRGLAERDGALYAAADNFADGFAVGTSVDDGRTWTPLLNFSDICEPLACSPVADVCGGGPWLNLEALFRLDSRGCGDARGEPEQPAPRPSGACELGVGVEDAGSRWLTTFTVALLVARRAWRRRRGGSALMALCRAPGTPDIGLRDGLTSGTAHV